MARVVIGAESQLAGAALSAAQLPLETGCRVIAVRSDDAWATEIEGGTVLQANDVVVLTGPGDGLARVADLAGERRTTSADRPDAFDADDLGPAAAMLIEMKDFSEVAVGMAYAALLTGDPGMASEVDALAERLDQRKTDLQSWVLQTALRTGDASGLASLLLLSQAAEDLGDRATEMVRAVTSQERTHPVVVLALGESDEVVERMTVADGSAADGETLRSVTVGTGFDVLALSRDGRYKHKPLSGITLRSGDVLIAVGPPEGRTLLATRCE